MLSESLPSESFATAVSARGKAAANGLPQHFAKQMTVRVKFILLWDEDL
jgi:hypothetical protein